jgi:hypothetical protein
LFTSRAVGDDACGVITVTEDNRLTKTHRNLTKIIATMPCPSVSRCWTSQLRTKYDDYIYSNEMISPSFDLLLLTLQDLFYFAVLLFYSCYIGIIKK